MNIRDILMPELSEIKSKEVKGIACVKNGKLERIFPNAVVKEGIVYTSNGMPLMSKDKFTEEELNEVNKYSKKEFINFAKDNLDKAIKFGLNDNGKELMYDSSYYKNKEYKELEEAIKDIHIVSEESFGNIMKATHYTLSCRVSKRAWAYIKHCFRYTNTYEINDEMYHGGFKGYEILPQKINELEEILEIPNELRYECLKKAKEESLKAAKEEAKKKKEFLDELKNEFSSKNSIDISEEVKDLIKNNKSLELKGELIYLNKDGLIYGFGDWFVIDEEYIHFVHNNGSDGAMWSINYISTGGAGAYGERFEKTEKRLELLEMLKKCNES